MKSRALFICIFNWYPKPPECRHQLGLEPQRRVPGSPHYHGSQISGPGYAASQFSYRRRIRRVPLKLQRCPTWYHRAQLQQSVSSHTNAFSTGFLIERSGTPDTVTRGGLIKSGHT